MSTLRAFYSDDMFSMRGWVSESYAPSCTSLTPSMRGVTRSHIKGGVDLQHVKLLSFKSVCVCVVLGS